MISKALEYGVLIIIVDLRNTSSTCPRRGKRLVYTCRLAMCGRCGFKADRDSVGVVNIWFRALQAEARWSGEAIDKGMKEM
ncbi:MAG: transposase, partial [Desulfurococcaceae archaeon]|nr:transposase [Desulfurococcaceae archaeon]